MNKIDFIQFVNKEIMQLIKITYADRDRNKCSYRSMDVKLSTQNYDTLTNQPTNGRT